MKTYRHYIAGAFAALLSSGLASCDYIHDKDLQPCDHYLRFTYTYNMKFADAFTHELTNQATEKTTGLYIFDREGKFIRSESYPAGALKEGRVRLDLEPGDYKLMAWTGLNETDYAYPAPATGETIGQWQVATKAQNGTVSRELSGLFQGTLDLTIPEGKATDYELPLVKQTNKIRFVLIDANRGTGLNADDFTIRAVTRCGKLDAQGEPAGTDTYVWTPYLQTVRTVTDAKETATKTQAVVAELNTLRLIDGTETALQLSHKEETTPFFNVSLTDFLLLTKMESHQIGAQEYLDRQDEYTVVIYLDLAGGRAHCLEVIVNDWTVRLDELNLNRKGA
ncbi:MAG: FimB/Mfa2 family fimbrial subunit [Parabacteroides sp.]|nr:FimB/Mfa2 family fimbrial subunit [Parabacteroides sp.]